MKYKFVGDGVGVPGLPHEITREEAQQLGVEEILDAAIANGNYVEAPPPAPPQMNTSREGSDNEE